jgi:phospholipase/carboxylesterase
MDWGKKTFDELQKRGVCGEFKPLKNTLHELKKSELLEVEKWLQEILPPLDSDLNNKL